MTRALLFLVAVTEAVSPAPREVIGIVGNVQRNVTPVLSRQRSDKMLAKKKPDPLYHNEGSFVSKDALLHDFVAGEGLSFTTSVINDSVMGGESESSVSLTPEGSLFQGTVTRANGGGFSSVRFKATDTAAFVQRLQTGSGVRFMVQHIEGCTAWKLQLNGDGDFISSLFGQGWVQWQADFTASPDGAAQQIAFANLVPTRYGKRLGDAGLVGDAFNSITGFGFMLSFLTAQGTNSTAFSPGPFALNVIRAEVY